jgi:epsin
MDELKKQLKNVSLYDVKAYVRKAQNVVYNYTEMEARVREATNNEPWGASSTLMQKIAAGTYNYREREEIIGMIFRRFTEKAANEWRQIYKALQLLEYLLKNGSERFVDDARANLSLITMLRSFHYIDSQGRDQGINVRTKAKTLVELLNNDSALRAERKKSRDNAKKFQGVAGGIGNNTASGAENYDEYGTYEGRIFGDGGVYGQRFEESRSSNNKEFEEYDVEDAPKQSKRVTSSSKPVPAKPEVDLFSFDDASNDTTTAPTTNEDEFDEFGDFQSSVQPASTASTTLTNNLASLYSQSTQQPTQPDSSFGDFTSFAPAPRTTYSTTTSFTSGPAPVQKQDAFSSLFQTATTKAHDNPVKSTQVQYTPTTQTSATGSAPVHQTNNGGEINLLDL